MLDVLILAAGRGQRLRPLTDSTPKSLLQVGRKTLLEHHLASLAAQGFGRVVINLAWLGGQVRAHVGDGRRFGLRVRYSDEGERALETGGGIVNALGVLKSDPFIVINADILCDFDYAGLGVSRRHDMYLVMVPNPPHRRCGDFSLVHGRLVAPAAGLGRSCTYSGIGCFRRSVFDGLDSGCFPLRPIIEGAVAARRVGAEMHLGEWLDVGTPERLEQARQRFA